ncbi:unnamed protein product, partial [Prunus brigantina]
RTQFGYSRRPWAAAFPPQPLSLTSHFALIQSLNYPLSLSLSLSLSLNLNLNIGSCILLIWRRNLLSWRQADRIDRKWRNLPRAAAMDSKTMSMSPH